MQVTDVSKCLDRKLTMLGFEVFDILAIFIVLSVLNFLFGETALKWLLVWLPTAVMATVLRYGKRGKPEKYLLHWLRFQIKPGVYSAWRYPSKMLPPPSLGRSPR